MPKRHKPQRRRSSAPAVRRALVSRKLRFERLEARRMLAVMIFQDGESLTIGSDLVDRSANDTARGQVYIYAADTFAANGIVSEWSFFDNDGSGRNVTPLVLQVIDDNGVTDYTVRGIGTTVTSNAGGVQTQIVDIVAGSGVLVSGQYTFGLYDGAINDLGDGAISLGSTNGGVVDATINSPLGDWVFTPTQSFTLSLGTTFSVSPDIGEVQLNTGGDGSSNNRTYSAQMTIVDDGDYSVPLVTIDPLGSLVYVTQGLRSISSPGETDTLQVAIDGGQNVTILIDPFDGLQPAVQWHDSGGTLLAEATSAAAGRTLVLTNVPVTATDTYTMTVTGLGGTTGQFIGRVLLNADVEIEAHGGAANDDPASAQDLEPAILPLGDGSAQRGAIVGSNADSDDWYRFALADGESAMVALSGLAGGVPAVELYDVVGTRLAMSAVGADGLVSIGPFSDTSSDGRAEDYFIRIIGGGSTDLPVTDGLVLHLDAMQIEQEAGTLVSQWDDLSGSGNHASISFGDPTLVASRINGQPAVQFDGDDYLRTVTQFGSQYTVFSVATLDGGRNGRLVSSGSVNWLMGYWMNREGVFYAGGWVVNDCGAAGVSCPPDTNPDLYVATSTAGGQSKRLFRDGALIGGPNGAGGNTPIGSLELGSSLGSEPSNGSVGEIVIYDRVLAADELDDVGLFLARKWGLDAYGNPNPGVAAGLAPPSDDYTLVVTRNAQFAVNEPGVPQDLTLDGVVVGYLDGGRADGVGLIDPPQPGLATEWHPGAGDIGLGALATFFDANSPTIPVFSSVQPFVGSFNLAGGIGVPSVVVAAGQNVGSSRAVRWSGEILIPEPGTYNFKDGVDQSTRLIIDGQTIISDSLWTTFNGTGGQGSDISPATFATAGWKHIEFIMSETSSGVQSALYWDYDPLLGLNQNTAFPATDNAPAGLGALIPTQFVRTGFGDAFRDFDVSVLTGDILVISTTTPSDGAGEFVNLFNPRIELLDPSSRLVASDDDGAGDGRNASLTHTATKSGQYTVRVLSAGETAGEFVLHVTGHSGSLPAFAVSSIDPADGALTATNPVTVTVEFSDSLLLPSLDATDLTIDGVPARRFDVLDHNTVRFLFDQVLSDGDHNVNIAAGSMIDLQGTSIEALSSTLVIAREISGTLTSDLTLSGEWRVIDDLVVPAGVTLTIEPGAQLTFEPGVELTVRGRIVAVGTPQQRIRLVGVTGESKWDGIHLRDSLEDNIFAYVDIADAQSSDGSIGAFASVLTIDNVTFAGSRRRYVRVVNASAVIRNSIFPDRFGPDEVPGAGDDNTVEMITGSGIMTGGQMIIEGNTFGTNKGHNDIIDFSGPVRPAPILQVLNNVFLGTADEMLDLGGDAYIEGNVFMHVRRDEFNTSSGHTNAISTGDGPVGATIVLVRNVFYDVEHVIDLEDDHLAVLEHNTIVGITPDGPDPGNGTPQEYSVVNLVIVNRNAPGRGAHLEGNIIVDVPERIFGEPDTARNGSPAALSDLVLNNTLLPSERCSDVIGQRPGTIMDLGTNILCGDPLLADVAGGDFSLLPGSPAIGAGVHGLDLGALVPAGATLSDWPALTFEDFADFTVDGPGVVEYRYRLDGDLWGNRSAVDAPIALTSLADGLHELEVIGRNYAGVWQDEADAVVRSWTVDSTIPHPVATGDSYSTDEDVPLIVNAAIGVLVNDFEIPPTALTAVLIDDVDHGTLSLNSDGSFTYTPEQDFFGSDTFTYVANDGLLDSSLATVTITVEAVNDVPVAVDDAYIVEAGQTLGASSSYEQVIVAAGPVGYWRLGEAAGSTTTVDVTGVHDGAYENFTAGDFQRPGVVSGDPDTSVMFDGVDNQVTVPHSDELTITGDLTVEFWMYKTAEADRWQRLVGKGSDNTRTFGVWEEPGNVKKIHFQQYDGSRNKVVFFASNSNVELNQWHYVVATVEGSTAKIYIDGALDSQSTRSGVVGIDNQPLTIGGRIGGNLLHEIDVFPGRLDEVAIYDRALSAAEIDEHFRLVANQDGASAQGVLTNDLDNDGDELSALLVENVTSGTLDLAVDGSFTYTALENFVGLDRFTYRADDGQDLSNVATVTIAVGSLEDATTVVDDAYVARAGKTLTVDADLGVLANDLDPHGDPLIAMVIKEPRHGELTLEEDGSFSYAPEAGFTGVDSFTYRTSDGTSLSGVATVTITVEPGGTFVAGRFVFYNGSAFDGNDPTVNSLDEEAIATDKSALLPGEAATLANYTSFPGGITGVMIDVNELADPDDIDSRQFEFRAGNTADPSSWMPAPRPNRIVVREGAGVLGSDRITLTWPHGALQNTWLQVTLKATGDTGLTEPDVFYFGSAVGDTGAGNRANVVLVDEVDAAAVLAGAVDPAAVDNVHDLNRDARVDAADLQIVEDNPRDAQNGLRL
ncbi:MAG: tandem-95 repeat protein, partial [Planctomycetes bacterium]|nr:tandem-95 repeat protein [Planctomycetota bacterium]